MANLRHQSVVIRGPRRSLVGPPLPRQHDRGEGQGREKSRPRARAGRAGCSARTRFTYAFCASRRSNSRRRGSRRAGTMGGYSPSTPSPRLRPSRDGCTRRETWKNCPGFQPRADPCLRGAFQTAEPKGLMGFSALTAERFPLVKALHLPSRLRSARGPARKGRVGSDWHSDCATRNRHAEPKIASTEGTGA